MKSAIYAIVNIKTDKLYVGSAVDEEHHWRKHRSALRRNVHHNKFLQRSWNKYGEEWHEFEILEWVSNKEVVHEREQFWIMKTLCFDRNYGFNIRASPDETKEKISNSLDGVVHSDRARQLLSEAHTDFTEAETWKVLDAYYFGGIDQQKLAKTFNITHASMKRILSGTTVYKERVSKWLKEKGLSTLPTTARRESSLNKAEVFGILDRRLAGKAVVDIARFYDAGRQKIDDVCKGKRYVAIWNEWLEKRGIGEDQIELLLRRKRKLSPADHVKIKKLLAAGNKTQVEIAKKFGVSPQRICDIHKGRK